jgi:hypothetical protein
MSEKGGWGQFGKSPVPPADSPLDDLLRSTRVA